MRCELITPERLGHAARGRLRLDELLVARVLDSGPIAGERQAWDSRSLAANDDVEDDWPRERLIMPASAPPRLWKAATRFLGTLLQRVRHHA